MRDPVDRVAEIKANDPRRRALIEIFDVWFAAHGENYVKATELDPAVLEVIDTGAARKADGSLQYSRQRVAGFLSRTKGTRVGGYGLATAQIGPPSKEVTQYKLTRAAQQPLP